MTLVPRALPILLLALSTGCGEWLGGHQVEAFGEPEAILASVQDALAPHGVTVADLRDGESVSHFTWNEQQLQVSIRVHDEFTVVSILTDGPWNATDEPMALVRAQFEADGIRYEGP